MIPFLLGVACTLAGDVLVLVVVVVVLRRVGVLPLD